MTAVAKAISYVSGTEPDVENLKIVVLFSAVGLVATLLIVVAGFDIGFG